MPQFALVLSPVNGTVEIDAKCEITGEPNRWRGKIKRFMTTNEALAALRQARVVPMVGGLDVPGRLHIEADAAIELQLLDRTTPEGQERVYIQFTDMRTGTFGAAMHDGYHDKEVQVGDYVTAKSGLGYSKVRIDKIITNKITKFGSQETRREMLAECMVF